MSVSKARSGWETVNRWRALLPKPSLAAVQKPQQAFPERKADHFVTTRASHNRNRSIHALEASNLFLADVQTGLGPFLAAYLAGAGWDAGRVGVALTIAGATTVVLQTPAGALVGRIHSKRAVLIAGICVLATGALMLASGTSPLQVYPAQILIGGAAPFLAPTLAAITMGLVGKGLFDRQFGKNQGFNSAGNVACALGIVAASHYFGNRAIFLLAVVLMIPTILPVSSISKDDIDYDKARGCEGPEVRPAGESGTLQLLQDRTLLIFLVCAFLFHFANAAMLPQLGEMLTRGVASSAAPFMSACIIVTQVVIMCSATQIGKLANQRGRKPLLLLAYGVLPVRALLYTLTHWSRALIGIQVLDGIANAIFGVVSILVVADLTRGTGRFNLVQGALATAVSIGAALSTTFGGKLIQLFNFRVSFLSLGAVALAAFLLLILMIPETLPNSETHTTSLPQGEPA
jgi:MFS family permease